MTHQNQLSGAEEPLFAPLDQPLEGKVLEELLRRAQTFASSTRKAVMWKKYRVWREDTRGLVVDQIWLRHQDKDVRERMRGHVCMVRNDAKDIARSVSVVWKNGAQRTFAGRMSKKLKATMAKLEAETKIDVTAPQLNELGFLQGPQIAIPIVRGKGETARLSMDHLPSHMMDVVHNIDDPCGDPAAVAWAQLPAMTVGAMGKVQGARVMVMDSVSLRTFILEGDRMVEAKDRTIVHEGGFCPCSTFRTRAPLPGDEWWDTILNMRLIDGTINVQVIFTVLDFVRKSQHKKLLAILGDIAGLPKQQVLDAERPMLGKTKSPDLLDVETHDFDTPPVGFLVHGLALAHAMAEPYGGRVESESGEPKEYARLVIPATAQTEQRNLQRPFAREFERGFWAAASVMMRAQNHPLADSFPDARAVDERFMVEYGALSQDDEDSEKDSNRKDWEISKGLTSQYRLMQQRLGPGTTEEEARRRTQENLDAQAEFNDEVTKRDLGMSQDGNVQTAAQAFGAQGTPAREANREEEPSDRTVEAQGDANGG